MPGIEDLMNIRTQGGTENAPMGMPPGMPPQMGGAPMGGPPQGGAPMPPPPPQMGGMPPEMGEQAPVNVEEDAVSLAEAVIERAGGDPQAAVAILDTAANMIIQSTEGGGGMPPGPDMGGMPPGPEMMNMGGAMYPQQMNMGGGIYPQYAQEGKYLEDETDELRNMIMESSRTSEGQRKNARGEETRYRDYQPEGMMEKYMPRLNKLLSFIPDPFQTNEYLADKRGFPSVSDLDADELRQTMENRRLEEEMEEILSLRRDEMLLERALADPDANDPEQVAMRERGRTQAAERARAYRSR